MVPDTARFSEMLPRARGAQGLATMVSVYASATRSRWRIDVVVVRVVQRRLLVRHQIARQKPMPILARGANVA